MVSIATRLLKPQAVKRKRKLTCFSLRRVLVYSILARLCIPARTPP